MMCRHRLFAFTVAVLLLASCAQAPAFPRLSRKVRVVEYPSLDWAINGQRLRDTGCEGDLQKSCPELVALGCAEIQGPGFYLGGLEPPYAVVICINGSDEPPNGEYFRQQPGLDTRYRSYVIFQNGEYRLIRKQSEFKASFAPVESTAEALSYAMAMTSLAARHDIDPNANVAYLVDVIEETHAEETPDGYLVHLFDSDRKMGCADHSFYAVQVLVTRAGEVREVARQEIYRSYACFDYGVLTLDED